MEEDNFIDIEEFYEIEEDEEVDLESYDEDMDWKPVFNLNDDEY